MAASASNLDDLKLPAHVEHAFEREPDASMRTIKLTDLTTTISKKKFMQYEHRLPPDTLQLLTLSIHHPKYNEIGYITAVRIERDRCSGMFLEVMDVDEEMFAIASTLFDKYGEMRPMLVNHEYYRGSGVWGRELNDGQLVIVFGVSVDTPVPDFNGRLEALIQNISSIGSRASDIGPSNSCMLPST